MAPIVEAPQFDFLGGGGNSYTDRCAHHRQPRAEHLGRAGEGVPRRLGEIQ
jgi:hypothetical protein